LLRRETPLLSIWKIYNKWMHLFFIAYSFLNIFTALTK